MKRATWLNYSLLLNLVLAGALAVSLAGRSKPGPASLAGGAASSNHSPVTAARPARENIATAPVQVTAKTGDWRDWIDALRAAGVPNQAIAGAVQADFESRWRLRQDELQAKIDNGDADPDASGALALEGEATQEQELQSALGAVGFKNWDMDKTLRGLNLKNLTLTETEKSALYDLQKNLLVKFHDLETSRQKGDQDDADYTAARTKAQADFDQGAKALLGDQRFATMQGGDDDTSGILKRSLKSLNATEEQMQSILQAQQNWTQQREQLASQWQGSNVSDTAVQAQLQALDAARDQAYVQVLGTNGVAGLQMTQDPRYEKLQKYATAWNLDNGSINYVCSSIQQYEQSVQAYQQQQQALEQQGQTVDWDAVNKSLQQYAQQTEQALRNYLGDDRFNKISRNQIFPFASAAAPPLQAAAQ